MRSDPRRITLLLAGDRSPNRLWANPQQQQQTRIIFVHNFAVLRYTIQSRAFSKHDVERMIIDHAATAADFLRLLATLPLEYHGDVLLLSGHGNFLSTAARGDGRRLYALANDDLDFYLREHQLVEEPRHSSISPLQTVPSLETQTPRFRRSHDRERSTQPARKS
ncbi:MAG TPA: hypothetical protein VLV78_06325 [Thermoanaerobaculia bacterium]|nr:hypothetical protein [Thermoanaerobaculia bacterium]